ncbi:hypothetical protein BH10CHL1_BH10CHL1_02510 [soil metagenome]
MRQFNSKRCAFTQVKKNQQKGIVHRYMAQHFLPEQFCRDMHGRLSPQALGAWDNEYSCTKRMNSEPSDANMDREGFNQLPASASSHQSVRNKRNHSVNNPGQRNATEQMGNTADPTLATRLVWVRRPGKELAKSRNLLERLSSEGIDVWVIEASNLVNLAIDNVAEYDLILFEYFEHGTSDMKSAVSHIRLGSRAPLMMLTDDPSVAWSLDALSAGADAIFTVNTPDEVILARCNALLRRWLANV